MTEFDEDLLARQEARMLCRRAGQAQQTLETLPQEKLDAIVRAMAAAFEGECASLAKMAVEETGFGNTQDKTEKNRFACRDVLRAVEPMKTVGILREDREKSLWEIGVPVGVIGAIVPSTNPTSTVCYKALIAVKAGCAIVFSPHPKAAKCSCAAAQILARAAEAAGAPEGTVGCLTKNKRAGTQEMMSAPEVKLLLATGGPGMVRAAYSSGKPAIGVGAGNGPAFIHSSADVPKAVADIIRSKTFDNGTVCASEQSIIVERSMETAVLAEAEKQGIYLMPRDQAGALAKLLFKPGGGLDPQVVGKTAIYLAEKAGFSVPKNTKVLMAREQEAGGRPHPALFHGKAMPGAGLFCNGQRGGGAFQGGGGSASRGQRPYLRHSRQRRRGDPQVCPENPRVPVPGQCPGGAGGHRGGNGSVPGADPGLRCRRRQQLFQ